MIPSVVDCCGVVVLRTEDGVTGGQCCESWDCLLLESRTHWVRCWSWYKTHHNTETTQSSSLWLPTLCCSLSYNKLSHQWPTSSSSTSWSSSPLFSWSVLSSECEESRLEIVLFNVLLMMRMLVSSGQDPNCLLISSAFLSDQIKPEDNPAQHQQLFFSSDIDNIDFLTESLVSQVGFLWLMCVRKGKFYLSLLS